MQKLYYLLISLCAAIPTLAQSSSDTASTPYWINMMQDPAQNFYQTQRAFNLYWENRTPQKGDGYKVFKRWEFGISPMVQPDGSILDAGTLFNEIDKEYQKRIGQQMVTFGAPCMSNGNWREVGPVYQPGNRTSQPNGMGRVNAIAFHPSDSNQIWIGAPAGGLWHSTDGGLNWITHTDTLATLGVSSIAIHPLHPDTIYIGTGDRDASDSYGLGVFVSFDGGRTWKQHNSGMGNRTVGRLIIDDQNPDVLLAATNNGIYRSDNGGNSWTQRISGNFKEIVFKPGNTNIVYASRDRFFYRSTDNGINYSLISSGIPGSGIRGAIAVTPADTNFVYFILCNQRTFNSLNLSTDGGSTFTTMSTTPNIMDYSHLGTGTSGQAWYDLDIAADPLNKSVIYVGGVNIFRSADSGTTWKINAHWVGTGAPAVHADHHVFEYNPHTNALYSGHDGGLHRTHNQSLNWVDLSKGLGIAQIYRLAQSAQHPDMLINGYQDNGTGMMIDGKWYTVMGGDGMDCAINPYNKTWAYSDLYYGDLRRYKDGFGNGTIAANGVNGINEAGDWVTPFVLQEGKPSTMFVGYKNVWRSNNVDTTSASQVKWTKISNNLAGSNGVNVQHLENSIVDPERLYMSRHDNKLFRTDNVSDASPNWTDLTSSLPVNNKVSWIESHPHKKDEVFITQGNKLYRSTDAGSNWSDYSSGLPNIPIVSIVCDSSSKLNGMYAGTFGGVYYRDSTMSSWLYYSDGLPLASRFRDLEIYYHPTDRSKSHVVGATYGRGNWLSPLYDEDQKPPVAGAKAENLYLCSGETLMLQDTSSAYPTEFEWIIQPSTYTFVNGSDSSSRNAYVRFNQKGLYTISHIARNCWGEDTAYITEKIEVGDPVSAASCTGGTTTIGNFGIGILNVELAGQSFSSATPNTEGGYLNFACTRIFPLQADTAYFAKITTGKSYDESVKVWIDFNDNGSFTDPGEFVFVSKKKRPLHQDSIRIPVNPVFNKILRMRVMSDYDTLLMPLGPCDSVKYGQMEDYGVIIKSPPAIPRFVINKDSVCTNESVTFTDSSSGIIVSYLWTFPSGASKDTFQSAGPHQVSFSSPGWQKVSLTLNGISVFTLDSAVYVKPGPVLSFLENGADTGICERRPHRIEVSATGNNITHFWKQNNISSSNTSKVLSFAALGPSNAGSWVFHAESDGCTDSLGPIVLSVYPHPVIRLQSDTPELCQENHLFRMSLHTNLAPNQYSSLSTWQGGNSNDTVFNVQFASNGTYTVKSVLTTLQQCSDSTQLSLEVLPHPVAAIGIQGADSQCLDGNRFELKNQSTFSGTYSLNWESGDATTYTTTDFTHSYSSAGSFVVRLVAESTKGCTDTVFKSLVVHPKPQASFSINQTLQCFNGHSYSGNSTSVIGNGSIVGYNWDFGDGNTGNNHDFNGKTYASAGDYTITLYAESDKGCLDTASTLITVAPNPVANFSINDSVQCQGENAFIFSNLSTINSGTLNADWQFGDGSASSSTNPSTVSYSDTLWYVVQLRVTSDQGCTDSISKQVKVLPGPVASFNGGTLCAGETFTLSHPGAAGTQVQWDLGNGLTSTNNPWDLPFPLAGNFDVTLYLTGSNGCSDTATYPAAIVVHPKPQAQFEAIRSGSDGLQSFFQTRNQSQGASSVFWDFGNGQSSSETEPQISYSDTGTFMIVLIARNDENCTDTAVQWVFASPEISVIGVNAFSPNGDGLNDIFRISGIEVAREYYLRIFNRWGETLFESSNPLLGWNGEYQGNPVPEGHYFYQLRAISLDGQSLNSNGLVKLVR